MTTTPPRTTTRSQTDNSRTQAPAPTRSAMRAAVRRHPATVFVLLAFLFTWSVWVPRALVSQGLLTARWPMILGSFWAYGPAAAAVIGRGALRDLGSRLIRWRVRWWWYPIVLLGPLAYWGVVYAVATPFGWSDQLRQPLPLTHGLAAAGPILLLLCLTDGVGEETGWRGFLLSRQLEHLNRLGASCLLGVIWAIWHLPLFWTEGKSLAGGSPLVMLVELPAVSIIFTWILDHTKQSALIAVLLHAAMNWSAFSASSGAAETWPVITLLLVSKWLIVVAIVLTWARQDRGRR